MSLIYDKDAHFAVFILSIFEFIIPHYSNNKKFTNKIQKYLRQASNYYLNNSFENNVSYIAAKPKDYTSFLCRLYCLQLRMIPKYKYIITKSNFVEHQTTRCQKLNEFTSKIIREIEECGQVSIKKYPKSVFNFSKNKEVFVDWLAEKLKISHIHAKEGSDEILLYSRNEDKIFLIGWFNHKIFKNETEEYHKYRGKLLRQLVRILGRQFSYNLFILNGLEKDETSSDIFNSKCIDSGIGFAIKTNSGIVLCNQDDIPYLLQSQQNIEILREYFNIIINSLDQINNFKEWMPLKYLIVCEDSSFSRNKMALRCKNKNNDIINIVIKNINYENVVNCVLIN